MIARSVVESHTADAAVAWAASGLLFKLAAVANRDEMLIPIAAGAHDALLTCLQHHPCDERVVRDASGLSSGAGSLRSAAAARVAAIERQCTVEC